MTDAAELYLPRCLTCRAPREQSTEEALLGLMTLAYRSITFHAGWIVGGIAVLHTLLNVLVVVLMANGVIHPPWAMFRFLMVFPLLQAGGAVALYVARRRSRFRRRWTLSGGVVGAFACYMVFLAYLNARFFVGAMASV